MGTDEPILKCSNPLCNNRAIYEYGFYYELKLCTFCSKECEEFCYIYFDISEKSDWMREFMKLPPFTRYKFRKFIHNNDFDLDERIEINELVHKRFKKPAVDRSIHELMKQIYR